MQKKRNHLICFSFTPLASPWLPRAPHIYYHRHRLRWPRLSPLILKVSSKEQFQQTSYINRTLLYFQVVEQKKFTQQATFQQPYTFVAPQFLLRTVHLCWPNKNKHLKIGLTVSPSPLTPVLASYPSPSDPVALSLAILKGPDG